MSDRTPIRRHDNIVVKLEAFNPAGSHKSRAARFIIESAIKAGHLVPGGRKRIIEKSGGNLGVGLAYEASKFGIGVDLVIGLSFSQIKKDVCRQFGASLIGSEYLLSGKTPRDVVEIFTREEPDKYFYTNQFANPANLAAHLTETGPELVNQIRPLARGYKQVILVKGAGTGASFQGIAKCLLARFANVRCELVMPEGCDLQTGNFVEHKLEGFAVGVTPPFLDMGLVQKTHIVSEAEARIGQRSMAREIGFFPGMSSGANYIAALRVAKENPHALVVTLAYDSGEAYLLSLPHEPQRQASA